MKLNFLIIFTLLLSGCSGEHKINTSNLGDITILFKQERLLFKTGSITHSRITDWINQNQNGWESYYATAAPGKYIIKASGLTLNIGYGRAVLNYEHISGEHRQVSKPVLISTFDLMLE
jgi:hypothetical protein